MVLTEEFEVVEATTGKGTVTKLYKLANLGQYVGQRGKSQMSPRPNKSV